MNRARQWQRARVAVECLSRDQIAARTGTAIYHGGWLDPRAGSVNPLAYARGLGRQPSPPARRYSKQRRPFA